ncbi:MAG: PAS domain-containing protein [Ferruginibacter sp.]
MESGIQEKATHQFLQGGGETGDIIRLFEWDQKSLGPINEWPVSLRSNVGMVLHAPFPMLLFWGNHLTYFYNDAYRSGFETEGKHAAIGKDARDVWPENWETIGSLLEKVMSDGKARCLEDQLLPFYRNGIREDSYWTLGFGPAYGDTDQVNGVIVTCTETTRKVQTLLKLSESDKRFESLVREASVGIIVLEGPDMIVKAVNEAYGRLIGLAASELYNKPLFTIIPESEPYFRQIIDKVRITGEPCYLYDHPYFILTDGGRKEGFLNLVYQFYREDDDTINGVMVLCQDVTEAVLARKKVEESGQKLWSLVESAPFPIGVYEGREMRIALANQSILDVWGKGNDVVGKLYADVLPELDNQEIFAQLDKVFTTGTPYHARNKRVDLQVNKELKSYYFNYSFTPLFDSIGNIYGVLNTAAETTDLNLAKQMVERSEQNLRNMILQAPVAMCILVGAQHTVEVANQFMIELWGKQAVDILHKPLFEGVPDANEQGLEQLLTNVYLTGNPFKANEHPVVFRRNGKMETKYQNFTFEPYRDGVGSIIGVLAVAINVTDQVLARLRIEEKVAERTKELAMANENLQRSNDELAQFAYIASHDLQEPLRKVSSFTEMLEQSLDKISDKTRNYLDRIISSTTRMTVLIRDVLSYSQLAKGNVLFEPVNLQQIVAEIEMDLELLIDQRKAVIITDQLPVINALPLQMSQLFANLISNALKFSKPGEPPLITISAKQMPPEEVIANGIAIHDTTYYLIEVKDNGIGFSAQYAEKIFNIFQRLHAKTEYSGTGIGLAICKKIAQNHQGEIFASSEINKGATFRIILPKKPNQ